MKKLIPVIYFLLVSISYSQTKSETKIIAKINRQVLSKKVVKKETFKEIGWHGGYEKLTVYVKNNKPILIEKELKEVIHEYLLDGTEKDRIRNIIAKFYILNWKKSKYIRKGQIIMKNQHEEASAIVMPKEYIFNFERDEIEKLIKQI